ncbi:MAG: acetyl-CoA carboxylase, biotin carboxyl carrier protein, partial [Phenylobacterium sp.]|nr:acetyl-CoA carboxylase, biotin carboxyl carrier protein [Phenylobacterium sp.]
MASSPKASADPLDARLVRTLADILTETGLSEIEVERDGLKVRVARQVSVTATVAAPALGPVAAPVAAEAPAA